jgi:Tfp pilus assembly protein PilW
MIRSEKGYSMMEVLISTALGTIVLAGIFDVWVSSTKSLLSQSTSIQMQTDTKAAMDYMIRELRMAQTAYPSTPLAITTTLANNDTITFAKAEDSGYSFPGNTNTSTTLLDTNKSSTWKTNQFAPTAATGSYSVWIESGTGSGQVRTIQSNTTTSLTLTSGWTTIPDSTSLYFIIRTKAFTLFADKTVRYRINGGNPTLLAQNVTGLSFALTNPCNTTTLCVTITLTAQSKAPDPLTGLDPLTGRPPGTYNLTDTARPRNH